MISTQNTVAGAVDQNTQFQPDQPWRVNGAQCWLSYAALAERLGVSERTIRRAVDAGKLPQPIKIRGCVRFDVWEVEAALKASKPN